MKNMNLKLHKKLNKLHFIYGYRTVPYNNSIIVPFFKKNIIEVLNSSRKVQIIRTARTLYGLTIRYGTVHNIIMENNGDKK